MLKALGAVLAVLAGCAAAQAAGEPNSLFVNDQTVFFARVQTDRIDVSSIEKFIMNSVGSTATSRPANFAEFQTALHERFAEVEGWLKEFKEAGGHEIDLVGQSDTMERQGAAVVVPLDTTADANQIAALLGTGHKIAATNPAMPMLRSMVEIVPNKAVLLGPPLVRTELKGITPVPQVQIAAAVAASGDAPEVLIIAPNNEVRAHLLRHLPRMIIAEPTAPIINGIQWIAQFATPPPAVSEHLVIQTADVHTAQEIAQLMNIGLTMMQALPDRGPEKAESRAILARLLAPGVNGDRVEINLQGEQMTELARAMEPYIMGFIERDKIAESGGHMRAILQAMLMYRNAHKGKWPESLDAIKTQLPSAEWLTNPRDPKRKVAYVYVAPKGPIANEGEQMVLYEAHEKFGDGVNVGFADGHIEFISSAQRFKDLLLQSYDENSDQ